jgi:hypothetical protein
MAALLHGTLRFLPVVAVLLTSYVIAIENGLLGGVKQQVAGNQFFDCSIW